MKDVWQRLTSLRSLCSGPCVHWVRPFTHGKHEGSMGQSPGGRTPGKEQMNFAEGTMNMTSVAELMVLMVSLYSIHQPVESLCGGACRGRDCPCVVSWPSTCWASSNRSVLIPGLWQ